MHPDRTPGKPHRNVDELVNKNETCPPQSRKRLRNLKNTLSAVRKEDERVAKVLGLRAFAATVTYADNKNFKQGQLSSFLEALKKRLHRRGQKLLYAWVLEKAERIHYHLAIWFPKSDVERCKNDFKEAWKWGSTWIEPCYDSKAKRWTRYLSKKETKLDLPDNARSFGYGGLDAVGKEEVLNRPMPQWVRELRRLRLAIAWRRGRWVDMATGQIMISPWKWTPQGFKLRPGDEPSPDDPFAQLAAALCP